MVRSLISLLGVFASFLALTTIVRADDADTIRQSAAAFTAAFNQGDAQAIAALWTPDGELVDSSGETFRGRAAIEAAYRKFFAEHPGATLDVTVDSVRLLSDAAALETGHAALAGGNPPAPYTAIHVKHDGKWQMASVSESDAPVSNNPLDDLGWLVGKWSGEERGTTVASECRWLDNHTYLERRFTATAADGAKSSGVQLIGRDPLSGNVMGWSFNSDGSVVISAWQPQTDGWAIEALGVSAAGVGTRAINLLRKLDDNAYAWQSVDRTVGDEPRPDTDELILKRDTTKATKAK